MGVVTNEPSMEDILSSIKRIIADGSNRVLPARPPRRRAPDRDETGLSPDDEESGEAGAETDAGQPAPGTDEGDPAILELTDRVEEPTEMNEAVAPPSRKAAQKGAVEQAPAPQPSTGQAATPPPAQEDVILSEISTQAARQSLSQLSSLLVRPQEGESNTLEGLVREMLRPMLKEWLEANLPDLVQSMVKKEIDRIVGRLG